jgi:hypothetical protein
LPQAAGPDKETAMKRRCPKCSTEWEVKGPIGFREECPECAAYLHTCSNCRIFDARSGACRSPTPEPVADLQSINFCEEFEYGPGGDPNGVAPPPRAPAARPPPAGKPASADDARRRFENLFRKDPE